MHTLHKTGGNGGCTGNKRGGGTSCENRGGRRRRQRWIFRRVTSCFSACAAGLVGCCDDVGVPIVLAVSSHPRCCAPHLAHSERFAEGGRWLVAG